MAKIVALRDVRSPAIKAAGKAAKKVHRAEKAQQVAKRINDREKYEEASRVKVEAQADFAAICKEKFPKPGVRKAIDESDSSIRLSDFCRGFGFHERTVQNWYALIDKDVREELLVRMLDRGWNILAREEPARASSESAEWFTPIEYIEAAREVLGGIDLDPASNDRANQTIKAKTFFDAKIDGLRQPWSGRVFMNPPYGTMEDGSSLAAMFCEKAIGEYETGNIDAAILLVNSMHSQRWQQPLYAHPICFIDHRIKFVSGDRVAENRSPTFQNMFVYLGKDAKRFAAMFSQFGYVMQRIEAMD
jgi:hypothetical protein